MGEGPLSGPANEFEEFSATGDAPFAGVFAHRTWLA
jgi:hypothetical protein